MTDAALLELLLANRPLVDVRAPVEFAKGSIPGAVNLPVLNDEERAAVGTTYKRRGQDAAIELGRRLVSGDVLESRLHAWSEFFSRHQDARLFCFRGGLRSRSVQEALRERGLEIEVIDGGYKRLRQLLIDTLETLCESEKFLVVSGYTGAGKTEALARMRTEARMLDLEHHARHRGSAFGGSVDEQPAQIDFENEIALSLARQRGGRGPILIEDESHLIGRLSIPPRLFARLSTAPVFFLERPRVARARHLIESYCRDRYGLVEGERRPEKIALLHLDILKALKGIERRLGGADHVRFVADVELAIADHLATGSLAAHADWTERLLLRYYDPLYEHHLAKARVRVVASGSLEDLDSTIRQA